MIQSLGPIGIPSREGIHNRDGLWVFEKAKYILKSFMIFEMNWQVS